jgi:hypothetical protein
MCEGFEGLIQTDAKAWGLEVEESRMYKSLFIYLFIYFNSKMGREKYLLILINFKLLF